MRALLILASVMLFTAAPGWAKDKGKDVRKQAKCIQKCSEPLARCMKNCGRNDERCMNACATKMSSCAESCGNITPPPEDDAEVMR